MEYKEIEALNFKMLKDNLFVTKQKLEKIFNQKPIKDTYTKELKKEEDIWNNTPVVFDRLI
jgi:predicted chitinase